MKRILALVLLSAIILSGCGQTATTPAEETTAPTETATLTPVETVETADSEPMTLDEALTKAYDEFYVDRTWDGGLRLLGGNLVSVDNDGNLWGNCKQDTSDKRKLPWADFSTVIEDAGDGRNVYTYNNNLQQILHYCQGEYVESFPYTIESGHAGYTWTVPPVWRYGATDYFIGANTDGDYVAIDRTTGEFTTIATNVTHAWFRGENEEREKANPGDEGYQVFLYLRLNNKQDYSVNLTTHDLTLRPYDGHLAENYEIRTIINTGIRAIDEETKAKVATARAAYLDGWDGEFTELTSGLWARITDDGSLIFNNEVSFANICLSEVGITTEDGNMVRLAKFREADYYAVMRAHAGELTICVPDRDPLVCELPAEGWHQILGANFIEVPWYMDASLKDRWFSAVIYTLFEDGTARVDVIQGNLDHAYNRADASDGDGLSQYRVFELSDNAREAKVYEYINDMSITTDTQILKIAGWYNYSSGPYVYETYDIFK